MNRPLVTPEKFAEISCLDGFVFGMEYFCQPCQDNGCNWRFNACLRRSMKSSLSVNESLTEREIGSDLAPKYHVDEIMWRGERRIQLERFGISELNVAEQVTDVASSPFIIHPYIIAGATVSDGSGFRYVVVDATLVDNPGSITFRNPSNGEVIQQDTVNGYPRRNGSDWEIAISAPTGIDAVDVYHCKYMQLTIATPICVDGEIFAVNTSSGDYIPFAKPAVVNGGNTTYWFYIWSLISPAFAEDELIDLIASQFYKLETTVSLKCSKSIEALPQVMREPDVCGDEFTLEEEDDLIITQIKDNILEIRASNGVCNCAKKTPVKILISYKTDPSLLDIDLENLAKGVVYLTAAQLPYETCGCEMPKDGFVPMTQKSYADLKINPVTGDSTYVLKFGNKYGELVYIQAIQKTKTRHKVILA